MSTRFVHRRRFVTAVALAAMLFQSLFGVAHLGASAAAAAGAFQTPDGLFGLLQICTPQGLTTIRTGPGIPAPQSRQHNASAEGHCPVCNSSSVAGFVLASMGFTAPVAAVFHIDYPEPAMRLSGWKRYRRVLIRAPPSPRPFA
jgi:hypothetical protein